MKTNDVIRPLGLASIGAIVAVAFASTAAAQTGPAVAPPGAQPGAVGGYYGSPPNAAYENLPAEDFATPRSQIPMRRFDLPPDVAQYIRSRQGPGQTRLELVQTALLNLMSSELNYARVLDVREQGETYIASLQMANGEQATAVVDPFQGQIRIMNAGGQAVAVFEDRNLTAPEDLAEERR